MLKLSILGIAALQLATICSAVLLHADDAGKGALKDAVHDVLTEYKKQFRYMSKFGWVHVDASDQDCVTAASQHQKQKQEQNQQQILSPTALLLQQLPRYAHYLVSVNTPVSFKNEDGESIYGKIVHICGDSIDILCEHNGHGHGQEQKEKKQVFSFTKIIIEKTELRLNLNTNQELRLFAMYNGNWSPSGIQKLNEKVGEKVYSENRRVVLEMDGIILTNSCDQSEFVIKPIPPEAHLVQFFDEEDIKKKQEQKLQLSKEKQKETLERFEKAQKKLALEMRGRVQRNDLNWLINQNELLEDDEKNLLFVAQSSEMVNYLIKDRGLDVNFLDRYGETPLMYHVRYCGNWNTAETVNVIEALLENGARVDLKSVAGRDVFSYLRTNVNLFNNEGVLKMLQHAHRDQVDLVQSAAGF